MHNRHSLTAFPSARFLIAVSFVVAAVAVLTGGTLAMDREELRSVAPQVRQWFESMRSPQGKPCCSYADGHRTEYDMKENLYWIPINQVWVPVPPEVVIYDQGNPFPDAVAWYNPVFVDGKPSGRYDILCFVPGGGS
jgi:hypothetical protein